MAEQTLKIKTIFLAAFINLQLHSALWKAHQDHFALCIAPFL